MQVHADTLDSLQRTLTTSVMQLADGFCTGARHACEGRRIPRPLQAAHLRIGQSASLSFWTSRHHPSRHQTISNLLIKDLVPLLLATRRAPPSAALGVGLLESSPWHEGTTERDGGQGCARQATSKSQTKLGQDAIVEVNHTLVLTNEGRSL